MRKNSNGIGVRLKQLRIERDLTLKQLAGHLADHDQNHIVQLENLRSAARPARRKVRKPKTGPRAKNRPRSARR